MQLGTICEIEKCNFLCVYFFEDFNHCIDSDIGHSNCIIILAKVINANFINHFGMALITEAWF